MNAASEKRLAKVHPLLAEKVHALAEALAVFSVHIEVVQGLRTFAEQDALFAQGRSKPGKVVTNARGGQSNHNYGLAVDVCPFVNGEAKWNDNAGFKKIGSVAVGLGLDWGGNWKRLVDMPHVQLPGLTIHDCADLYKRGGLDAVWAAATKRIKKTTVATAPPRELRPEPIEPSPGEQPKPEGSVSVELPTDMPGDVTVTATSAEPEKITTGDVQGVVTGHADSFKAVFARYWLRITAFFATIWASGLHGKLFLIALAVIVVALGAYELSKFWPKVKPYVVSVFKGFSK